jgi:protein-L-isoaspartate(D-aspartate) O-methyltransferase
MSSYREVPPMDENYREAREKMVDTQLIPRGIRDPGVLNAMRKIPRHLFVEGPLGAEAYADHPLPIGQGQTISQPYIVALMTEALELTGSEKTLELGTGSGYQAAILAELSARVYTIERVKPLLDKAKEVLDRLGYGNIEYKLYNGTIGWEEHQPYDAIMVTAGAPRIPDPLLQQLADHGRLIIPLGNRYSQELIRVTKKGDSLVEKSFGGCRFVSLVGEHGWKEE